MSTCTLTLRAIELLGRFVWSCRAAGGRLAAALVFLLGTSVALAQEQGHPLKPPDRSSPRATLKTFLDSGDALGAFLAGDYLPSPSRAKFHRVLSLGEIPQQCLDLSEVPPAARLKTGRAAAAALYGILSRIPLPPLDEIPDPDQVKQSAASKGPTRWTIPNTEIALVRAESGPRSGEFLFSADTVARAGEFYERVRGLPYVRPVPLENVHEIFITGGGWMIPYAWIQSLPGSLRAPLAGQAGWKWIGSALILGVLALFLWFAYRVSQLGHEHPFLQALAQFAMPASILAATPAAVYLALVQLNLIGTAGSAVQLAATAVMFLAGAWMVWRLAPVVAEAIIASPRVAPEGIDAHLIRVAARLLAIGAGASLLAVGADRLGVPVYGIVAGLGIGGVAIALAAQPTVENLLGGLSLFADKPLRVGDVCEYGDAVGTVEAIGLRSARIRGADRTLTTIPNAALAKMPIVNLTRRDRMLIQAVIGLRYETNPEQLRCVLVKLREMLLGHPRVDPDPARARFIGFGASSLDIEVFAYVMTRDWAEFLGIQEDILLRVMDIVEQGGVAFAFASQTLYLDRDRGPDDGKAQAAEARVQE